MCEAEDSEASVVCVVNLREATLEVNKVVAVSVCLERYHEAARVLRALNHTGVRERLRMSIPLMMSGCRAQ